MFRQRLIHVELATLLVVTLSHSGLCEQSWTYNAVYDWSREYPTCGYLYQSPINIETDQTRCDYGLRAPFFSNGFFSNLVYVTIGNNGHSVSVDLSTAGLQVSNAGIHGTLKAVSFHFHWGSASSVGSEHTVNRHSYAMELHLVCVNAKYNGVADAARFSDGLAVLAFFIQEGGYNYDFVSIIDSLSKIPNKGNQASINSLNVGRLLNTNLNSYYRYFGSLTTPSCSEPVTWTVFKDPIMLSSNQIWQFRNLIQLDSGARHNYRPTQNLNGRQVYRSIGNNC